MEREPQAQQISEQQPDLEERIQGWLDSNVTRRKFNEDVVYLTANTLGLITIYSADHTHVDNNIGGTLATQQSIGNAGDQCETVFVQKGDYASTIAKKYGETLKDLERDNPSIAADPNLIHVGDPVKVHCKPGTNSPTPEATSTVNANTVPASDGNNGIGYIVVGGILLATTTAIVKLRQRGHEKIPTGQPVSQLDYLQVLVTTDPKVAAAWRTIQIAKFTHERYINPLSYNMAAKVITKQTLPTGEHFQMNYLLEENKIALRDKK